MIHELKTWPQGFEAILAGTKTHEVRPADRAFEVGDVLYLREFIPHEQCKGRGRWLCHGCTTEHACCAMPHGTYTGRDVYVTVNYITGPGTFGLPTDRVVMSISMRS